jgi:hypothetical protein
MKMPPLSSHWNVVSQSCHPPEMKRNKKKNREQPELINIGSLHRIDVYFGSQKQNDFADIF